MSVIYVEVSYIEWGLCSSKWDAVDNLEKTLPEL